jgi:hypothetical protein
MRLVPVKRPDMASRVSAAGPLNLDNLRAEISKEFRAIRPGDVMSKIENLDVTESGVRHSYPRGNSSSAGPATQAERRPKLMWGHVRTWMTMECAETGREPTSVWQWREKSGPASESNKPP